MNWAPVPSDVLNIPETLRSGQAFRWRQPNPGRWVGVMGDAVADIRPERDGFWWQTAPTPDRWDLVARYFALDVDIQALYASWLAVEPAVGGVIARYGGLRILRQDAEEVFFSFLCASCNTIRKITRSVTALARLYGEPLAEVDGEAYHRFPSAGAIAAASEADLRTELWGYRAPRLIQLARHVEARGAGWLDGLRDTSYAEAHAELSGLYGIGPKIADCICLFGLGFDEAVPVDTHVRQIAVRLYRPDLAGKSVTPRVYEEIAALYRQRFGEYAGWAQQYLFLAELT